MVLAFYNIAIFDKYFGGFGSDLRPPPYDKYFGGLVQTPPYV